MFRYSDQSLGKLVKNNMLQFLREYVYPKNEKKGL